MTDDEVRETRNDLEMMRRPRLWPHLFLPLVHRTEIREGILFEEENGYGFLPDRNMFDKSPIDESKLERGGDELLVRLCEEGWLVD